MVSPAGFEPATPGLEGPHFGVSGVFPMRYTPRISTDPGFRSIYAIALKTPIPWLRGDAVVTDADTQRKPCDTWRDFVNEAEVIAGPWPDSSTPMQPLTATRSRISPHRTTASLIPKRIAHRQLSKILPRVKVFRPKNLGTRRLCHRHNQGIPP